MNLNALELMEPIFRFLDSVIEDYGLYIYMGMVYVAPFLIAWILSGGLRRKQYRHNSDTIVPIIIIHPPLQPPPPPPVIGESQDWPYDNDDFLSFDE
jgi:hypothetical protein